MGLLGKLTKKVFRSRSKIIKEGITEASTNNTDDHSLNVHSRDYPVTPHHGAIFATSQAYHGEEEGRYHHHEGQFFNDDFEKALYNDEETTLGPMILLHASNCSTVSMAEQEVDDNDDDMTILLGEQYYYHEELEQQHPSDHLEVQTTMEPSFEIALMNSIAPRNDDVPPLDMDPSSSHAMTGEDVINDLQNDTLATCFLVRPQTRYDIEGKAFVHIYNEGLSTVPEANSMSNQQVSSRSSLSKMVSNQKSISDEQKVQARWGLARDQLLSLEMDEDEEVPTAPKSPSYSRRTRMWFKGLVSPKTCPRSVYEV